MIDAFGRTDGGSLGGRRVAVLGLGRSGFAAVDLLRELGAIVRGLDVNGSESMRAATSTLDARLGDARIEDLEGVDLIVTSPGVRPDSAWRRHAATTGIPVWSEIELAWRAGIRPLAAITGTNGKTTATRMATEALRAGGLPATAAGNIGIPLCALRPGQPIVAEVSSFQLESIDAFAVPVAVLLNLAPDHLDWHGSMEAYAEAKQRLFSPLGPEDTAIAHTSVVAHASVGAAPVTTFDLTPPDGMQRFGLADGWLVEEDAPIVEVATMRAREVPFLLDALAAAAIGRALGTPHAAIGAALAAFVPDPHRLERIAHVDGVLYVNDSKATDPHATQVALEATVTPTILIAGGLNKGLTFDAVAAAADRVRVVLAIGTAAAEIAAVFEARGIAVEIVEDLAVAVARAAALAEPGDTVLFSPACASFDQFQSYEHRGEVFRAAVTAGAGEGTR